MSTNVPLIKTPQLPPPHHLCFTSKLCLLYLHDLSRIQLHPSPYSSPTISFAWTSIVFLQPGPLTSTLAPHSLFPGQLPEGHEHPSQVLSFLCSRTLHSFHLTQSKCLSPAHDPQDLFVTCLSSLPPALLPPFLYFSHNGLLHVP